MRPEGRPTPTGRQTDADRTTKEREYIELGRTGHTVSSDIQAAMPDPLGFGVGVVLSMATVGPGPVRYGREPGLADRTSGKSPPLW